MENNIPGANEAILNEIKAVISNKQVNGFVGNDTYLIYTISNFCFEAAELLVKAGADLNLRNKNRQTPLEVAILAYYGEKKRLHTDVSKRIVTLLISHGADVNATTSDNDTCLGCALFVGDYDMIQWLITAGAEATSQNKQRALSKGDPQILDILGIPASTSGSTPSPTSRSSSGCFIATAVYGDYNAPEVLQLRLYRDTVLSRNTLGRCFIRCYYFLSPPVARWLENQTFFSNMIRKVLDRLVAHLHKNL